MRNRYLILFLIFNISVLLYSLEDDKPLWVEFQEAKSLYENGHFQEALDFFLDVTTSETPYPEAEYMIGMLYLEEGELALAEKQVIKAIDLSSFLEIKEDLNKYKYSLANIYLLKEEYDNYVYTLKDILGKDEIDIDEIRDQKAYYDSLLNSGIDRLLHLYRKEADNVLDARLYLGYFYNSQGDYKASVNYLLSPMLALFSEAIEDKTVRDREYLFESMEIFLTQIQNDERVANYFKEHDVYKVLYYLGESLYGLGEEQRGLEIWTLLANSNIESLWVNKAKKQVLNPILETWKFIY